MSERFKHREESHGRQVCRGTLPGARSAGSGIAAGTAAAGESVKEKLDKVIENGNETNRLLRSLSMTFPWNYQTRL